MRQRGIFNFVLVLGFFALLFLPLASAFYLPSVRTGMEMVISSLTDIFEPILRALFGGIDWSGAVLFEKLLLFILLVSIIYVVTGRIPLFQGMTAVRWIVAVVVPLIGVRFIELSSFFSLFTQYQIFAIIIASVVPFILYFYFLYEISGAHGVLRKIGWLVFVGIYVGLWSTATDSSTSAIYFWTFVASLVMLFGDNLIMKRLEVIELYKTDRNRLASDRATILREIDQINQDINANRLNRKVGEDMIKGKESHLKWLTKRFG